MTVNPETLTLGTVSGSLTYGLWQTSNLSATETPAVNGVTVDFYQGSTLLGSASTSAGTATCNVLASVATKYNVAKYPIVANVASPNYTGTGNGTLTVSQAQTEFINPPTRTLEVDPNTLESDGNFDINANWCTRRPRARESPTSPSPLTIVLDGNPSYSYTDSSGYANFQGNDPNLANYAQGTTLYFVVTFAGDTNYAAASLQFSVTV